jgi:S-layer homology domain
LVNIFLEDFYSFFFLLMSYGITPRIVALGTVFTVSAVGMISGVFGTFSTTILSGNTCSGYGFFSGYGYGYNCTPTVSTSGGGGGGSSVAVSPVVVNTTSGTTVLVPTVKTTTIDAILATDIAKSPYKSAIEMLISKGVMNNVAIVSPTRPITRAEFMKLISIANGYTVVKVTKKFGDLPSTNSLVNYVNFGVSKGWVNVKNANFRPNDIITQGEIDKLIAAIKGTATADTIAKPSLGVMRGKAASDIVNAFYSK